AIARVGHVFGDVALRGLHSWILARIAHRALLEGEPDGPEPEEPETKLGVQDERPASEGRGRVIERAVGTSSKTLAPSTATSLPLSATPTLSSLSTRPVARANATIVGGAAQTTSDSGTLPVSLKQPLASRCTEVPLT